MILLRGVCCLANSHVKCDACSIKVGEVEVLCRRSSGDGFESVGSHVLGISFPGYLFLGHMLQV